MERNRVYEHYNEFAKTRDPGDLLGQVRRTINGTPVGADQISLIHQAISSGLDLQADDIVLDLCCGNGMLSDVVFAACRGGVGVDFGEYLVGIARANFERLPHRRYVVDDVLHFLDTEPEPERFTKTLCYSSFQYFSTAAASRMLNALRSRFVGLGRIFLGNMPDRDRLDAFAPPERRTPGIEHDPETPIGVWRTASETRSIAAEAGWRAEILNMPSRFYGAHYRFDAVLTPA